MATTVPSLWEAQPPTTEDLNAFLDRHRHLLQLEHDEEEEQTRLLHSNCSPKLLEQKGLALGGLGVSSVSVGLGGKTLVELHRPLAYHVNPAFPPHTFRNGDPVRIEEHAAPAKGKGKKKDADEETGVDGVVFKVGPEKVVVAVREGKDVELPERLRLLKLANTVTFDRMRRTLDHLGRLVAPFRAPEPEAPSTEESQPAADAEVKPPSDAGQEPPVETELQPPVELQPPTESQPEHPVESAQPQFEAEPKALKDVDNRPLINALLGIQQPTWSAEAVSLKYQVAESSGENVKWFSESLNDSQKEAIDFCLRADQVACIHGPPGTGKTHTLIELIFQLLARPASPTTSQPPRILVTTPSNLALDNLLLRLHTLSQLPEYSSLLPPGSFVRLGHPTRVHRDLVHETLDWRAANGDDGELVRDVGKEIQGYLGDLGKKRGERGAVKGRERGKKWDEVRALRKEYRQREAKVVTNVVKGARVILATCHSAGARQINNMMFDVAIVDEATQAVEAVCWVPILKARKLILAGDPQQLPPTIMSRGDKKVKRSEKKPAVKQSAKTAGTGAPKAGAGDDQDAAKNPKEQCLDQDASNDAQGAEDQDTSEDTPGAEKSDADSVTDGVAQLDVGKKTHLRPPRTLETTLFDRLERLYGPGIKRVLKVQYRMNEQIAQFPSVTLYKGELVSAPSVASHTLLDLPTIIDPDSDDSKDVLEAPVVFFDTAGCEFFERAESEDGAKTNRIGEGSKSNENEATVVAKWARKLVALGVPANEVGIVVPYQAQVALLSSLLHEEFPEMTIGTVDGLQGQERDAIILSLVRSNATGEVGFLGEYRRLNVAMTRPRRQLCVVGDSDTVSKGSSYLKKWMTWLEDHADVRYAGDEI